MSVISQTTTSSKPKKPRFSRLSKILKSVASFKIEKSDSFELLDIDALAQETVKPKPNEWTINIVKNSVRQHIIESVRRLQRTDSWLASMEAGVLRDVENMNKSEANNGFLWAAFLGKFDLMVLFESRGADVSYVNETQNFNALHLCALNGSLEGCKWLHERGCPVLQTIDGFTPMHYAAYSNSTNVIEFLIETYGCRIPDSVLNCAVYANAVDCVKLLLRSFVNVNSYYDSMTPLHIATDLRHIECLKVLLQDPSVDVNAETETLKYTALHIAADNGYADCLRLLIKKKARLDAFNFREETPLHMACKMNNPDSVKILLENRAPVNAKDSDFRTPLHAAISEYHRPKNVMKIVEMLLHWNANLNASDRYGYTPLHLAAIHEYENCATYLILNGANPAAETKTGLTALNVICRRIPDCVPAIWKRFTHCLAYNSEEKLKFDFRELITNSKISESGFLYILQNEGHGEMLQHPLCKAFLYLKWQKLKWYYYFLVLLVLITTCSLSVLVIINFSYDCDNLLKNRTNVIYNKENDKCNLTENELKAAKETCEKTITYEGINCTLATVADIAWWTTLIMSSSNIVRKISCMVAYSSLTDYFRSHSNIVELLLTLTIFPLYIDSPQGKSGLQKLLGTAAVLLSWIHLTQTVGQLPYLGTYIAMYKKVFEELVKLLSVYFTLLLGFNITFHVIFPRLSEFNSPITSFVRMLSMMIGDLNLDHITNVKETCYMSDYHKIAVFMILFFFIILVTMALMNLLIGIAVKDVDQLKKNADIAKLVHQTQLMYFLELSLFYGYIPRKLTGFLEKSVFICPKFQKMVIYMKPHSRKRRIPTNVMMEALRMALEKHKKTDGEEKLDISKRMEAVENKMTEISGLLSELNSIIRNVYKK